MLKHLNANLFSKQDKLNLKIVQFIICELHFVKIYIYNI